MNRQTITAPLLGLFLATLAGCAGLQTTVKDALDYGRGPFDQSPAAGSGAALEGLHESSWGNSGKWGSQDPNADEEPDTQGLADQEGKRDPDESDPPISDQPK